MLKPQHTKGFILCLFSIFIALSFAHAQDEKKQEPKKGPPPAIVVVEETSSGMAEPMNEFVGTVYYSRVSEIASEVAGKVASVNYDEGHRVKQGQTLVTLGSDLLS
ncbi:MAG TPA: efflux RND transporter periplasmic adaptor subunit, partial [Nitrospirae bacterium]|nr:efflux RND transporter periplasmic adaptor subunit [Nitrospirota bacterium]